MLSCTWFKIKLTFRAEFYRNFYALRCSTLLNFSFTKLLLQFCLGSDFILLKNIRWSIRIKELIS